MAETDAELSTMRVRQHRSGLLLPATGPDVVVAAKSLLPHATAVVTAVTAVAYVIGVERVSQFAASLNVSPRDLGIDSRDYLVLALIPALPITICMTTYAAVVTGLRFIFSHRIGTARGHFRLRVALIATSVLVLGHSVTRDELVGYFVFRSLGLTNLFGLGAGLLFGSLRYGAWRLDELGVRSGSRRVRTFLYCCAVLWLVPGLVDLVHQPERWARQLLEVSSFQRSETDLSAFGLDLLFEPGFAEVSVSGDTRCVVRVTGNVLLYGGSAAVFPDARQADMGSCEARAADIRAVRAAARGDGTAFFYNKDLQDAALAGSDLRDAEFTGADLSGASLQGSRLASASFRRARLERTDLGDVDLTDADLRVAILTEASLVTSDLSGADLTAANMTGADLTGAILTGADLRSADLSGADLTLAVLDDADLTSVVYDERTTIWPDGFVAPPSAAR